MTHEEFQDLGCECTVDEFEIIHFVYSFHPSISETDGKKQIAHLFTTFGKRVIYDMHNTAKRAKELEDRISKAKRELSEATIELRELKAATYEC